MQKVELNSYGIIPIFKNEEGFYILLVKNSKGGHWGLPKGTPEKGEKPMDTATRELLEETGIKDADVKTEITFEEKYDFERDDISYSKTNTYYPGFVSEMTKGTQLDQIDEVKWVKINEAKNTITHQAAMDVVSKLSAWLTR